MKFYTKIFVWENNKRLEKLGDFRKLVLDYFSNSRLEWMADGRIEEESARQARVSINRSMDHIHDIVLSSGINPSVTWTPPPAVGGHVRNIDLIQNVFNLHAVNIEPNIMLDYLDRSIGVYASNHSSSLIRAFNPLSYMGLLFDAIAETPFIFIGKLGLNRQKAESSVIGKLVKGGLYLITVFAALLTIMQLLGLLEPVKQYTNELIGYNNAKQK